MNPLRYICSILLSLTLMVMPLQSYAMMIAMGDAAQVEQAADTDNGCQHGNSDAPADTTMNCCFGQCDQDCDASCSAHSNAATLPVELLASLNTLDKPYLPINIRHPGLTPSPPLPPPLIQ